MSERVDVAVVGAGPAGCAAVLMAASLGMSSVLIEEREVGAKLSWVGALENVPGQRSGVQLADALAADMARLHQEGRTRLLHATARSVDADDREARVELGDGTIVRAGYVVVATGTRPVPPAEVNWLATNGTLSVPALWEVTPADLPRQGHAVVLGADRPLGTWLRTHADFDGRLHVLYPATEAYKADEVRQDPRVTLTCVASVRLAAAEDGTLELAVQDEAGAARTLSAAAVLLNSGSAPAALAGLQQDADGYCPPTLQHRRIRVAGDLRSPRFQRITVAQGSGAEAVLCEYYAEAMTS